jgi:Protoglobin
VLVPKTEQILDIWYGFVGSNPHLVYYFADKENNQPDMDYLNRVRARFGRWIKDTTDANFDQAWLDWQHEIGLRHNRLGKNKTDGVNSVDQVNFRYLVAFIYPISATIRPFLAASERTPDEIEKMHAAWTKAVVLQTILWSYPYIKEGQF